MGPSLFSPERKSNRLPNYNYASNGAYFITICTKDQRPLFWKPNVGEAISLPDQTIQMLNDCGKVVSTAIESISEHYPYVTVDKFVIMPNHLHLILFVNTPDNSKEVPTISTIVGQMKRWASKTIGRSIWQRSFHDHVIRGEKDYQMIWTYIDENPYKWELDCFYTE